MFLIMHYISIYKVYVKNNDYQQSEEPFLYRVNTQSFTFTAYSG